MNNQLRQFLTGQAGTGKTYLLKKEIERNPRFAILCATTGAAAVNLGEGVTTINSLLGFFDTPSLINAVKRGWVKKRLRKVTNLGYQFIAIDEVSMMDKDQLDIIHKEIQDLNDVGRNLGLILTGDFCQLPPIKGEFAFKADCWDLFKDGTCKLEKVWRQTDVTFLAGINAARRGNGVEAYEFLGESEGIQFTRHIDNHFDGTTLYGTNNNVDTFNDIRVKELMIEGKKGFEVETKLWGKQKPEWKNIPIKVSIVEGSYVMCLANNQTEGYVNGDCGYVQTLLEDCTKWVPIKLVRNDKPATVGVIERLNLCYDGWGEMGLSEPEYLDGEDMGEEEYREYLTELTQANYKFGEPWFHFLYGAWVIGAINYMPIRLAYATTVHKSQGLSLDRVQINMTERFFAYPAMMYVALSRARTPQGLRLVGDKLSFIKNTNVSKEVLEWI